MAKGEFRFSPFAIPLKTTKKGLLPLLGFFPGVWFMQSVFQATKKRDADAYWIARRGSRNTLRLSRLPYVKYSTGAHGTTRKTYRALRKPDPTVARRAFLDHRWNDNTHNETNCFSARQRYFASPAPLFCILFSGKTEKSMPSETQLRSRNKEGIPVKS